MSEQCEVSRVIPAPVQVVFDAWLSSHTHGEMTGSIATYNEATGEFSAWDGYISGRTLTTAPPTRVIQSWRSTEFPGDAPDSVLEVLFEKARGGTLVTVKHSNSPDGQSASYAQGWNEYYFNPMTRYFAEAAPRRPAKTRRSAPKKKAQAKKRAAKKVTRAKRATRPTRKKAARRTTKR